MWGRFFLSRFIPFLWGCFLLDSECCFFPVPAKICKTNFIRLARMRTASLVWFCSIAMLESRKGRWTGVNNRSSKHPLQALSSKLKRNRQPNPRTDHQHILKRLTRKTPYTLSLCYLFGINEVDCQIFWNNHVAFHGSFATGPPFCRFLSGWINSTQPSILQLPPKQTNLRKKSSHL